MAATASVVGTAVAAGEAYEVAEGKRAATADTQNTTKSPGGSGHRPDLGIPDQTYDVEESVPARRPLSIRRPLAFNRSVRKSRQGERPNVAVYVGTSRDYTVPTAVERERAILSSTLSMLAAIVYVGGLLLFGGGLKHVWYTILGVGWAIRSASRYRDMLAQGRLGEEERTRDLVNACKHGLVNTVQLLGPILALTLGVPILLGLFFGARIGAPLGMFMSVAGLWVIVLNPQLIGWSRCPECRSRSVRRIDRAECRSTAGPVQVATFRCATCKHVWDAVFKRRGLLFLKRVSAE